MMLHIKSLREGEAVFKALSAPMRLKILELISQDEEMSMNQIAEHLGLTNSAVSLHVGILKEAGLVIVRTVSGQRGNRKFIRPVFDKLLLELAVPEEQRPFYQDDISIGCFTDCKAAPTCGLATPEHIIGSFDDPRYFTFTERFQADIFWFGYGYVEYSLPNHLQSGQKITELQISLELSSECPGYQEDYPSDIYFSLNGTELGYWVSPGDFGARKGMLSPQWWPESLNQYGLLKTLIINKRGTFIDGGSQISDITIDRLGIDYNTMLTFRLEVKRKSANCRGLTVFGKHFGDYNQGIRVKTFYKE